MRTNTLVTLGASAVFGVMAIVLARGWIQGAVENEFRQTPTQPFSQINPPIIVAPATVPVLVANLDLNFGDELTPESFRLVDMPQDIVPLDALSDPSEVFPIDYDPLQSGYRAVSVQVDAITGVAGFIVPGDLVDIQYLSQPAIESDTPIYRSEVILQSIRVLGIDQSHNRNQDARRTRERNIIICLAPDR